MMASFECVTKSGQKYQPSPKSLKGSTNKTQGETLGMKRYSTGAYRAQPKGKNVFLVEPCRLHSKTLPSNLPGVSPPGFVA